MNNRGADLFQYVCNEAIIVLLQGIVLQNSLN